ncbi:MULTISPECIES: hypothetical protein [Kitasatospora]|uniref:Uncharacterized protein n=1 Tax=Kitasatospora cystarginea TaxID=58350 RepID=A0ABP5QU48_9ACTN
MKPAQAPGSDAFPVRRYDLVKEFTIALVITALLSAGLAGLFSSPDETPITLAAWSTAAPNDFTATAVAELAGTSTSAQYGPPYNHTPGAGQKIGPVSLQRAAGVRIPVDPAEDFVLQPLRHSAEPPEVTAALTEWNAASADQRQSWSSAYADALGKAPDGDPAKVGPGDYGPVPVLTAHLLTLAQAGSLDGQLLGRGRFYQTDFTKPMLFLADGSYLSDRAAEQHLTGSQWGMMNETGDYPGQAWLWLYTFWYQIDPFTTSKNADAEIWAIMAVLSLALVLVPFIPGIRSIPRWTRIYRLVWRDYYRTRH